MTRMQLNNLLGLLSEFRARIPVEAQEQRAALDFVLRMVVDQIIERQTR